MRLTSLLATAAIISMVATPAIAANANPAAGLSLAGTRAGDDTSAKAPHKGGSSWMIYAALGVAAVVGAAVALGHNDSKPASS